VIRTKAIEVYVASDGELTKAFYAALQDSHAVGAIAVNLFRAQKCSARAKVYRGRGNRSAAYERKQWSMGNLCDILFAHADSLAITWGWKEDPGQAFHAWVLYVDLPGYGQVSFHTGARGNGPDYPGKWDGTQKSAERICAFCDWVLALPPGAVVLGKFSAGSGTEQALAEVGALL